MFDYELEKTSKKLNCPSCGAAKKFKRYIKKDTREYLADNVGRCDRSNTCGYNYTPKQYFVDNPSLADPSYKPKRKTGPVYTPPAPKPDLIPSELLTKSLAGYDQNTFVQFLLNLFPDDGDVWETIKKYFVGTFEGKTCFWQIDFRKKIRTGKLMLFDTQTGSRIKDRPPDWIHAKLKRRGQLADNFNLGQCFFGEHLLVNERLKPIAIVEAEKTAVIASICQPEYVWIAAGSKHSLKAERLKIFDGRKVILYPDGDGFAEWSEVADAAQKLGLLVRISHFIEDGIAPELKAKGYDLADYIIEKQTDINTDINEWNEFVSDFNARVERIAEDPDKTAYYFECLEERIAVCMESGLSLAEAEAIANEPLNSVPIVFGLTRAD